MYVIIKHIVIMCMHVYVIVMCICNNVYVHVGICNSIIHICVRDVIIT